MMTIKKKKIYNFSIESDYILKRIIYNIKVLLKKNFKKKFY